MIIKPVGVGLKVCEKAIVEKTTGKVTLVNCLRRLRVKSVPTKVAALFAFVSITDGLVSCRMEIKINHLETMNEIDSHQWKADFSDPLREQWFLVPLGPLEFAVAGRYEVALLTDNELITRSVIDVTGEKP